MSLWYRLTIGLGRLAMRVLGISTRWAGEHHLPVSGPVLLACVHVSYPDFLFVGKAALARNRAVRFMCRHDVWHVPLVRRAMDSMRHVPVDRRAPAAAYLRARRLLAEGEAVCVFPEAGISHSFTVRALMRGVAALARETGVPVVPVVVWGSQRIFTVGRDGRRPRPDLRRGRTVDVRFGPPTTVAAGRRPGRGDRGARAHADRDAGVGAAAAGAPAPRRRARAVVPRTPRRARAGPARRARPGRRAALRGAAHLGTLARPITVRAWGPCRSVSVSVRTP